MHRGVRPSGRRVRRVVGELSEGSKCSLFLGQIASTLESVEGSSHIVYRSDGSLSLFAEWDEGIAVRINVECIDEEHLSVRAEYYNIVPLIVQELGQEGLHEFYERLLRVGYKTKFHAVLTDHNTIEVTYCHPIRYHGEPDTDRLSSLIASAVIILAALTRWFHRLLVDARAGRSLPWLDLEELVEQEE